MTNQSEWKQAWEMSHTNMGGKETKNFPIFHISLSKVGTVRPTRWSIRDDRTGRRNRSFRLSQCKTRMKQSDEGGKSIKVWKSRSDASQMATRTVTWRRLSWLRKGFQPRLGHMTCMGMLETSLIQSSWATGIGEPSGSCRGVVSKYILRNAGSANLIGSFSKRGTIIRCSFLPSKYAWALNIGQ